MAFTPLRSLQATYDVASGVIPVLPPLDGELRLWAGGGDPRFNAPVVRRDNFGAAERPGRREGIVLAAQPGQEVRAIWPGRVIRVDLPDLAHRSGYSVWLDHENGLISTYGNLELPRRHVFELNGALRQGDGVSRISPLENPRRARLAFGIRVVTSDFPAEDEARFGPLGRLALSDPTRSLPVDPSLVLDLPFGASPSAGPWTADQQPERGTVIAVSVRQDDDGGFYFQLDWQDEADTKREAFVALDRVDARKQTIIDLCQLAAEGSRPLELVTESLAPYPLNPQIKSLRILAGVAE